MRKWIEIEVGILKNIKRKEEIELLKIIKRISDWWIRRSIIQLPDNYIHVEGNLSKGIRMDAHAEGHASKGIRMDAHAV